MAGARTRLFVLLGRPVGHSLSPAMQNAAFQALGLDAVYAALDCAEEDLPAFAGTLAAGGGGGNATVPHKGALAASLAHPSARVARLATSNVFWGEDGALAGDSTDVDGVLESLAALGALDASTWLVMGTGGSARAVAGAAAERQAKIVVRSRSEERAREFGRWAESLGVAAGSLDEAEVLINATPVGLDGAKDLPMAPATARRARWALDLVYRRGETEWVRHCRTQGLRAADGREMLVAQGAASLERWFPKARAPREVMRAAVARALA